MAQSFIERYLELVDHNLSDPHTTRRLTTERKLRDLEAVEVTVWERLLAASGQETVTGRHQVEITLENDKEFYLLPGNFRRFWWFRRFQGGDTDVTLGELPSIAEFDFGPGVFIITPQRGMQVIPKPNITGTQTWTLCYQKGPVKLHYARAGKVGAKSIAAGTPPANGGEIVFSDGYYNGSVVNVYRADKGSQQAREVLDWNANEGTFVLKHAFSPTPTGDVWYEIMPALPEPYDHLYAMDVAIRNLGRRPAQRAKRRELKDERKEMFNAAINFVLSGVADRAPERIIRYDPDDADPYE